MTETSLAIQAAVIAALKSDGAIAAIVGEGIYDRVPDGRQPPYIKYGEDQLVQDDADCIAGYESFVTLHGWSRAVGQPEIKRLAGAVRARLHDADLTVSDHRLHHFQHESTRYLNDPDGLTSHAVIVFRALLDPLD